MNAFRLQTFTKLPAYDQFICKMIAKNPGSGIPSPTFNLSDYTDYSFDWDSSPDIYTDYDENDPILAVETSNGGTWFKGDKIIWDKS